MDYNWLFPGAEARPVGAKGWTRDRFMGLERYGYGAVMAGLADPSSRTPRTVNPLPGPPKPLPVPTAEQLEESAAVVDDLATLAETLADATRAGLTRIGFVSEPERP